MLNEMMKNVNAQSVDISGKPVTNRPAPNGAIDARPAIYIDVTTPDGKTTVYPLAAAMALRDALSLALAPFDQAQADAKADELTALDKVADPDAEKPPEVGNGSDDLDAVPEAD